MYPARLALSDKAIIALPFAPSGQQHIIRDTELPGFFVIIGKRTKAFMARGDLLVNGKRQSIRIKIDEVGEVTTREARAKAKELLGSIATRKGRSEGTIENFRDHVERLMADWLDQPMSVLGDDPSVVAARHEKMRAGSVGRGTYSAGEPSPPRVPPASPSFWESA